MKRAKSIRRRWPGKGSELVQCWDTTPWGGGHVRDTGTVGAVSLPDGGKLFLDSGIVIHFDQERSGDQDVDS